MVPWYLTIIIVLIAILNVGIISAHYIASLHHLHNVTSETLSGYGGLSLSIEGPSKAEIECRDNYDGTCQVSYTPNEPGTYMVNIKYANEHVLGSPFAVKITGEPSAKLMEKIICRQEAADITQVGSQCELTLKVPGKPRMVLVRTVY